jgi:hypothetical protein
VDAPTARRDPAVAWAGAPRAAFGRHSRVLNATADVYDLRDRTYQPALAPLKPVRDFRREVPVVRDQLDEGACTGFAMAAVVNFVMARNGRPGFDASPRFLYEHAKRYDEWKGHRYEGSSIRGAMKGFHKHGVCSWRALPYEPGQRLERLPARALDDAADRPLGAYYRVSTSTINDMQSALSEAGILLVSAQVHRGWDRLATSKRALARIPWDRRSKPDGGHAFALVGYDHDGFIVQNSWGREWGSGGFAHLSYEDWLANRMDAWVAQMGVGRVAHHYPLVSPPTSARKGPSVEEGDIHGHYVAIDNGDFDSHGAIRSFPSDLNAIAAAVAKHARGATTSRPAKVLLWAHGGLVGEDGAAERTLALKTRMLAAGVYPIHFIWHTGLLEEVGDLLFGKRDRAEAVAGEARVRGWLKDKLQDAKDGVLELATRPLGAPVWREMKVDAHDACFGRGVPPGPAIRLLDALRAVDAPLEYHLVGHSAGAILHCHLVGAFARAGVPVKSVSFLAPAVSLALFRDTVMTQAPAIGELAIHTMTDADERGDHCGELPGTPAGIYHKSLLYLVSYGFEDDASRKLVGLARHIAVDHRGASHDADPEVRRWLARHATLVWRRPRLERPGATLHGSFDEDPQTLDAVIARVVGKGGRGAGRRR